MTILLILVMIYISLTDIRKGIIPNYITLPLFTVVLVYNLIMNLHHFWFYAAGLIPALGFMLLSFIPRFSIGGGDIKLIAATGFYLGPIISIPFLFFSFLSSSVYFIFNLIFNKDNNHKKEINKMGPHFFIGFIIIVCVFRVHLLGDNYLKWLIVFSTTVCTLICLFSFQQFKTIDIHKNILKFFFLFVSLFGTVFSYIFDLIGNLISPNMNASKILATLGSVGIGVFITFFVFSLQALYGEVSRIESEKMLNKKLEGISFDIKSELRNLNKKDYR